MAGPIRRIRDLYRLELQILELAQPVFLLAIRLYWGWQFFVAGKGKLMTIEKTAEFFDGLGIPIPLISAYVASSTECIGGLCLLAGAAARIVTLPLIFTMLVAYATAHRKELFAITSNPPEFLSAPPFLFLLASLIVLLFGAGAYSVDGALSRIVRRRSAAAASATIAHG